MMELTTIRRAEGYYEVVSCKDEELDEIEEERLRERLREYCEVRSNRDTEVLKFFIFFQLHVMDSHDHRAGPGVRYKLSTPCNGFMVVACARPSSLLTKLSTPCNGFLGARRHTVAPAPPPQAFNSM